jgi:hypothetical protein
MLREFLCTQPLVARLTVASVCVSIFLLPLSFGVQTFWPTLPLWLPSMLPLVGLFAIYAWVGFAYAGLVPRSHTPWAFTPLTLWVSSCCIDQTSAATIAAGVDGFERFLTLSDGMIAFVSPTYLSRLWCVFELATFCRAHGMHADGFHAEHEKLLLVSPSWPRLYRPCMSAALTDEEQSLLETFDCRKASCFKPVDRGAVLQQVRDGWGSEERFNTFVRTKLPRIFAASKKRYFQRLPHAVAAAVDSVLGD